MGSLPGTYNDLAELDYPAWGELKVLSPIVNSA